MKSGFLIVVEGIDGAGKSTLITTLAYHLKQQGYSVLITFEPGDTPFGQTLRHVLQHSSENLDSKTEFLLFAADRSEHIQKVVFPALQRGEIVISDRMEDSSMAYQGYGRGLDRALIHSVNKWVMAEVVSDIVFYVRLDWDTARQRLMANRTSLTSFEQEKKDFFERVINGFDEIAQQKPHVKVIDGVLSPAEIAHQALTHVLACLKRADYE